MLEWLRKQVANFFSGKRDEQTVNNFDQCLLELAQIRRELNQGLAEKSWSVDKIVIERLQTDKVELNLGAIDVRDLSGMLSIGFNYGGKLIRADSKGSAKTSQQPLEKKDRQEKPVKQSIDLGKPKPKPPEKTPEHGKIDESRVSGEASSKAQPVTGTRIQIRFKG